jgi:hypothetical protein
MIVGNNLLSESVLPDPPVSLVAFYPDTELPRIPILALASGPHIYMYHNRKPYYKFTLPSIEPCPFEIEVWDTFHKAIEQNADALDYEAIKKGWESLRSLRESANVDVSERAKRFLTIDDPDERLSFVLGVVAGAPKLKIDPAITFMTTLKMNKEDEDAQSCLVVGSEEKVIYIITPPNYAIVEKVCDSFANIHVWIQSPHKCSFSSFFGSSNYQALSLSCLYEANTNQATTISSPPVETATSTSFESKSSLLTLSTILTNDKYHT